MSAIPRPLYSEAVRFRQKGRLVQLSIQRTGPCAREVHRAVRARARASGRRCPSADAFDKVLGMHRTCELLKDEPMRALELSRADAAKVLGMAKSNVLLVYAWLEELGLVEVIQRGGKALFGREVRAALRTAKRFLTDAGRTLLGLDPLQRLQRLAMRTSKAKARWDRHYAEREAQAAVEREREARLKPPEPELDEGARSYARRAARHIWEGIR